jgi:hypothetical protein
MEGTNNLIGRLRNGHGLTFDEMRAVRLAAAEQLEAYQQALQSLREYAQALGIDTASHPMGKPLPEVRAELLKRVDGLAKFAYTYWTECDVGPERTWGANLYEIIRTAPREARE